MAQPQGGKTTRLLKGASGKEFQRGGKCLKVPTTFKEERILVPGHFWVIAAQAVAGSVHGRVPGNRWGGCVAVWVPRAAWGQPRRGPRPLTSPSPWGGDPVSLRKSSPSPRLPLWAVEDGLWLA